MRPRWNGNKWVLEVYAGDKRLKSFTSTDKARGDKICEKRYMKWRSEGERDVKDTRISTLWALYYTETAKTTSESAMINIASIYNNYLARYDRRKLEELTLQDFQSILGDAYKKGLSKKYIMNIRSVITSFLRFLRRSGYETPDPADMYIPKNARLKKGKEILKPEHVQKLLSGALDSEPSVNYYRFLLLTGMRPGEALGLTWDDVDGRVVTVNRAINVRGAITDGKNDTALRTLVISKRAEAVLEKQRALTAEMKSQWVFGYDGQEMPKQRTVYCRWSGWDKGNGKQLPGLAEKIGCPGTSLYSFRHTYVSRLQAENVDLRALQAAIGHTDSMDTYGTYGKVTEKLLLRLAEDSDDAFDDVE